MIMYNCIIVCYQISYLYTVAILAGKDYMLSILSYSYIYGHLTVAAQLIAIHREVFDVICTVYIT